MATDYFLKLDGIPGESSDAKHKGEIDIESWSWGVTQTGTHQSGGGGGAGKASPSDLTFSMNINKSSPKLFLACATGEHIKTGVLTTRRAGTEQQEYLVIKLTDILVSGYHSSGSGQPLPSDQVSLNFAKFEVEYKPQKPDGSLDSPTRTGYNYKENIKV